jgi:hypothetical protein
MVSAMAALPAQTVNGYDETITPHGLGLKILNVDGMAVVHMAYTKDATPRIYHVARDGGNSTAVVDASSGQRYTTEQLFWAPTWSTRSPPSPPSQTTVISSVRQRALADLLAPADDNYTLSLVGVENFNGTPVYHLHLVARDAGAHPLTDVYVDQQAYLVRRAVAAFTDNSVTNVTGVLTMNFDRVGRSWLLDSGQVDATVHAFLQHVSGSATFAASRVSF